MISAGAGVHYAGDFRFSHMDCVQAVDNQGLFECVFPAGMEVITRPEWEELFPEALFYEVQLGLWRSPYELPAHQEQDGGFRHHIVAWQTGEAYPIEHFARLLERNGVLVTDENRESIARALALMSIPNHLNGEVRFLEWGPWLKTYDENFTHSLYAWTEIWGCSSTWLFEFSEHALLEAKLREVTCHVEEHGDYLEDESFVEWGCEGDITHFWPRASAIRFPVMACVAIPWMWPARCAVRCAPGSWGRRD